MNSKAFIAYLNLYYDYNLSAKLAIFYVLEYRKNFFSSYLLKESKKIIVTITNMKKNTIFALEITKRIIKRLTNNTNDYGKEH